MGLLSVSVAAVLVLQPHLRWRDGGNRAIRCSARRCTMLRIASLTSAQQRELQQWQRRADPCLARRAEFVLWSARGWSVPALAHAFGCCRRAVRRWLHAFLSTGLAGLQPHAVRRAREPAAVPDSPPGRAGASSNARPVPGGPLSGPELRRILPFHWVKQPVSAHPFLHWSTYLRYQ